MKGFIGNTEEPGLAVVIGFRQSWYGSTKANAGSEQ